MKSKQPATLDWHFFDGEGANAQEWTTALLPLATDAETSQELRPRCQPWFVRWRYEFFLLFSVGACLLWMRLGYGLAPTLPITPTPSTPLYAQGVTTTYFHFQFGAQQTQAVYTVAARIDRVYEILSDGFGLAPSASEPKLMIIVGLPITLSPPSATTDTLFIPAAYLTMPNEADQAIRLAHYLLRWLMGRRLDQLMQSTRIQPVWQPMLIGLRHYFAIPLPTTAEAPTRESCAWWRALPTLSLDAVLGRDPVSQNWWNDATHLETDEHHIRPAKLLAEYLVTTYGQGHLSILVRAFRRYTTWRELSPAVFGLPAANLEADWHTYLAQQPKPLLTACKDEHKFMLRGLSSMCPDWADCTEG